MGWGDADHALPATPSQISSHEEPRQYAGKIAWNARNNTHMPLLATGPPAINVAIKVRAGCPRLAGGSAGGSGRRRRRRAPVAWPCRNPGLACFAPPSDQLCSRTIA